MHPMAGREGRLVHGSQVWSLDPQYRKKEIGKVVYTGASGESWSLVGSTFNWFAIRNDNIDTSDFTTKIKILCDYYKARTYANTINSGECTTYQNGVQHMLAIKNTDISSAENFKTWLSTHNTTIYYVLATPTYTLIEDSTLIEELESMKKSYENQTNISQENNDMPFELDVSVTFLTPMEINNIGNIYAKPILTIEGTGNIGVVLNDIQILDIDLTNNGKIAIDVTKLEAYNPDDDTLLNRLVTGDYMKLLINEGENTITFTGNVSGATLTNYIRWI